MRRTWFGSNIKYLSKIDTHQVIPLLSRQLSGSLSPFKGGLFNPTGKRITLQLNLTVLLYETDITTHYGIFVIYDRIYGLW